MHLQDCRHNEKMCDHVGSRSWEKARPVSLALTALYKTRRSNRFARHKHPLVPQGRSTADLSVQEITPTTTAHGRYYLTRPHLRRTPPSLSRPLPHRLRHLPHRLQQQAELQHECEKVARAAAARAGPANGAAASPQDLKPQSAWTVPWPLR